MPSLRQTAAAAAIFFLLSLPAQADIITPYSEWAEDARFVYVLIFILGLISYITLQRGIKKLNKEEHEENNN